MISIKKHYDAKNLKKNQIVLDIETTGLDPNNDSLVLLGLIKYEGNSSYIFQYFAENDLEEKKLLKIFQEEILGKKIISYNGENFDFRFLNKRLAKHNLFADDFYDSFDIYKYIKNKRNFFDFESMKLVDIEKLIDIHRNDPSRYKSISKLTNDLEKRDNPKPILIHNQNDLISTEKLINIKELVNESLSIKINADKIILEEILINNDIALIELDYKGHIIDSYFQTNFYQLKIEKNKIEIFINILYGKISENVSGFVTKNIFNNKNQSVYKINPNFLIIKEKNIYNYKNILELSKSIILENIS